MWPCSVLLVLLEIFLEERGGCQDQNYSVKNYSVKVEKLGLLQRGRSSQPLRARCEWLGLAALSEVISGKGVSVSGQLRPSHCDAHL